jgi:cell division transport system permease protein
LLARRQEIEVLQLVGATEALIQAPMVFEALLQGLFGAGCALAVLWGIWRWLRDDPIGLGDLVPLLGRVEFLDGADIALMFAIGILLAAAASLLALRGMIDSWEVHRSVH